MPNDETPPAAADLKADLLRAEAVQELEETHISWVFLGRRDVWKVKKPVALGFLDFSTPARRRQACEAEVRLNRRLAPEVYRGVVPITRDASGRHRLGGGGTPVDWAVHMKRLPLARRGDRLLAAGRLGIEQVDRVAARLAAFHRDAARGAAIDRFGTTEAIAANVRENVEQTRDAVRRYLTREQAEEIERWQLAFLAAHSARFEARIAGGRVRDGHGDLRLEHLYFDPEHNDSRGSGEGSGDDSGIVVVDCIEFNDRFRYADVAADIAFLAMDLAEHGRVDLAERLLASYARASDDFDLYRLVDFYESYRAHVRAKVLAMLADDPGAEAAARERAGREVRRHFLLTLASGRRPLEPPRLIAVGGVIAAGKSTVAERIATVLTAPIVDSDRTRKHLLHVAPTAPVHVPAFADAYDAATSDAVYGELLRRARVVLGSGRTAIVDASFRSRRRRRAVRDLARELDVPFLFVECRADPSVCRHRLRQRAQGAAISDGRLEIFDAFLARFEPVDELAAAEHLVLRTDRPHDTDRAVATIAAGVTGRHQASRDR